MDSATASVRDDVAGCARSARATGRHVVCRTFQRCLDVSRTGSRRATCNGGSLQTKSLLFVPLRRNGTTMTMLVLVVLFLFGLALTPVPSDAQEFRCRTANDCRSSDGFAYCHRPTGRCDCRFSRLRHGPTCNKVCTDNGRTGHCGHGVCRHDDGDWLLSQGLCNCSRGWQLDFNDLCNEPVCTKPCLNGGWCSAPDSCVCSAGFSGDHCQIERQCPSIPSPRWGSTQLQSVRGLQAQVFSCDKGFHLHGTALMLCVDGRWNAETPDCQDFDECWEGTHECLDCEVCLNAQGTYSCARVPFRVGWVKDPLTGKCVDPGSLRTLTAATVTTASPPFHGILQPATEGPCPMLALPANATAIVYSPPLEPNDSVKKEVPWLTSALIKCQAGYQHGSPTNSPLVCVADGLWLGKWPSCVRQSSSAVGRELGNTGEANRSLSSLTLIVTLSVIGVVLPTAGIVILACWWQRRSQRRRYGAPASASQGKKAIPRDVVDHADGPSPVVTQLSDMAYIYVDSPSRKADQERRGRSAARESVTSRILAFELVASSSAASAEKATERPTSQHYASQDVLSALPAYRSAILPATNPCTNTNTNTGYSNKSSSTLHSLNGNASSAASSARTATSPRNSRVSSMVSALERHHSNSTEVTSCSLGSDANGNSADEDEAYQTMEMTSSHSLHLSASRGKTSSALLALSQHGKGGAGLAGETVRRSSEPAVSVQAVVGQRPSGDSRSLPRQQSCPSYQARGRGSPASTLTSSSPATGLRVRDRCGRGAVVVVGSQSRQVPSSGESNDDDYYEDLQATGGQECHSAGGEGDRVAMTTDLRTKSDSDILADSPQVGPRRGVSVRSSKGSRNYVWMARLKKQSAETSSGNSSATTANTGLSPDTSTTGRHHGDRGNSGGTLSFPAERTAEEGSGKNRKVTPVRPGDLAECATPARNSVDNANDKSRQVSATVEKQQWRSGTLPRGFGRRHRGDAPQQGLRPSDIPFSAPAPVRRSASSKDVKADSGSSGGVGNTGSTAPLYANCSDLPFLSVEFAQHHLHQQQRMHAASSHHVNELRKSFHRLSQQQFPGRAPPQPPLLPTSASSPSSATTTPGSASSADDEDEDERGKLPSPSADYQSVARTTVLPRKCRVDSVGYQMPSDEA